MKYYIKIKNKWKYFSLKTSYLRTSTFFWDQWCLRYTKIVSLHYFCKDMFQARRNPAGKAGLEEIWWSCRLYRHLCSIVSYPLVVLSQFRESSRESISMAVILSEIPNEVLYCKWSWHLFVRARSIENSCSLFL